MASFNANAYGQPQQQMVPQGGSGLGFWSGTAAGAGGMGAASYIGGIAKTAKVAEGVSLATAGIQVLGGNQAQSFANQAMTLSNAMTSGTNALTTADTDRIRGSIQALAQGMQNLNPLGYLGLQQSTQPTVNASTAAPAASQNLTGILLVVMLIFFFMR